MGYGSYGQFYLLFGLGVLAVEVIAGRHRDIYTRSDWLVNLLCGALGMAIVRPILSIGLAFLFVTLLPGEQGMFADAPFWLVFLVTLLVTEFLFYWVHRWAHEGRNKPGRDWLWRLHRTHHSGKYMNLMLMIRINPFWAILQPQTWTTAFALYAGQPIAAALVALTTYAWNVITHSNFRWDDSVRRAPVIGRLFYAAEHIFVSPGVHHTHHGYGKDGANYRNFGVVFSIFDTMFGTLHIPQGRPWRYGVPGADAHWTEEVFYPFVRHSPKKG
ncbi:sterol desaturase family protein [Croceicoccus estronivorus]|uniref:sterol desaturase family protein n=1 Tax=Croceicoccus estronivorus TaxID=1172626 RepID=UPI000A84D92D|nr:sterol desaturase family protein [Croceicoccus estronivorus]